MREYFLIFVVAAVFTYGATPFVRALALVVGAITPVRDRDVHDTPIPRLGGLAILAGFLAAVLVAMHLPFSVKLFSSGEIKGVVLGAAIVCFVGAIDDVRELDALTKLSGQVIAAAVMAYQGVQLISLPVFGVTVLPTPVLIAGTVLIVLVTANAVNFIDGLDGLAAGIVGIASLAFFAYSYLISKEYNPPYVFSVATFISAALLGCCVGFLPHNFYPARLFMGDSGALLLGLLLSSATITMTGSIDPSSVSRNQVTATLIPILVPLAVLSLPLFDMAFAIVRRTRAGQRPWQPDSGHLHHRML
ncbi:MAG TPA: MraY family glycosyltransferase, partial [Candidatus Lustribacter sp.]|nr:MraY family glycosyltransferase [Candidatus Lustribacter sp.]